MTQRPFRRLAGTLTTFTLAGAIAFVLTACGDHRHYGRPGETPDEVHHAGYARVVRQDTPTGCGPAALRMILLHHDVDIPLDTLAQAADQKALGASFAGLAKAAKRFGFDAQGWKLGMADLRQHPLPALVKVAGCHFAVVERMTADRVVLLDPKEDEVHLTTARFEELWDRVALIIRRF
ncbi:MAG: hypothetical protein FJY97_04290 [candidate division Zixibacteria bacterium]|nr:hypothetical protein [candidate division Zixibacteria bacterium]